MLKCGKSPTWIFRGYHSTEPGDLFIVSRGDRTITHADYDGRIRSVLCDRRMVDLVTCFVSLDQTGFGGSGPGKAVYAWVPTVMNGGGRQALDYAVDDGRTSNGEQLPLRDETHDGPLHAPGLDSLAEMPVHVYGRSHLTGSRRAWSPSREVTFWPSSWPSSSAVRRGFSGFGGVLDTKAGIGFMRFWRWF
ncbi:MAG TPA: hypothetical protein VKU80_13750 [Planctomycetota bacterium]|nr:hypothetical protein [Planctomycetota bacterium]